MPYPRAATVTLKPALLEMEGISERAVREHWRLYETLVVSANDVRDRLQRAAPLDQPYFPSLRRELARALNGVKQHAIYFSNLGGKGGEPSGSFAELVRRDFDDVGLFLRDLTAAALGAEGWVFAVVDQDDGHLYTLAGEAEATLWEGSPVLALDVCEHAYAVDYGLDREAYVHAFLRNVDWDDVNARTERALRRHRG